LDVGLKGSEANLFAYYQFSPLLSVLNDATATKQITNKVGDWLHGLPQPDPTDPQIFAQVAFPQINSYSMVEGQSDAPDLPPLSNTASFESWPESNTTTYTVVDYSTALQSLLDSTAVDANIYTSTDGMSVTVIVYCVANDCSNYAAQWKSYYIDYEANFNNTPTATARMYLQIVTACPSGVFDECGTCDGDNSLCQCVVYHGFEAERMSFVLLDWTISNLFTEINDAIQTIDSTLTVLSDTTVPNPELRQQISDLMTFYNTDLTPYCGDVQDFLNELEAVTPNSPEALIDFSADPGVDGSLPFVPSFNINF